MADNTKIVITAEDRTQAALKSATAGIQTLSQSISAIPGFGGIAASIGALASGAAFKTLIVDTVHWAAGMDDLAEKTGASVENLSGLSRIAKISGADMGLVENGLIRLSKALAGADEESKGAGNALAFLGLKAEELRKLDSAEALKTVADAMNQYGDGTGKTAIALDIFGKQGAQLLPLLKDLAEQQLKAGKLTTEQAAAAEALEKAYRGVSAEGANWAKEIAIDLIPTLASLLDFVTMTKIGIVQFGSSLAVVANDIMTFGKIAAAGIAGGLTEEGQAYIKQQLDARSRFVEAANEDMAKRLTEYKSLRDRIDAILAGGTARKPRADYTTNTPGGGPGKKERAEKVRLMLPGANNPGEEVTLNELITNQKAEVTLEARAKAMDEAHMKRMEDYRIDTEGEEAVRLSMEKTTAALKDQKSIADDLGLTFASAFEDAIVGGKEFSEVLRGLGQDLVRLMSRKLVTEPLADAASDFIKSDAVKNFFSGLFKPNAAGGVYASPSLSAYSGGIYNTPRMFAFANGAGIFGEAGAEAIMPLKRGANGRLGVEASGGGGTVNNVSVVVNAEGGRSQGDSTQAAELGRRIESAVRAVLMAEKRPRGLLGAG